MTTSNGASQNFSVYSACGEIASVTSYRYGYVGAWGYQTQLDSSGMVEFPYLHVGARYYDPASGLFLQRDPIGIKGDSNVFQYVMENPISYIDPNGHSIVPPWVYKPSSPW